MESQYGVQPSAGYFHIATKLSTTVYMNVNRDLHFGPPSPVCAAPRHFASPTYVSPLLLCPGIAATTTWRVRWSQQ